MSEKCSAPVRFGVIGCGLMGREFASVSMRWLHLAGDTPRPVITAACDVSPQKLDWFRRVPDTKYLASSTVTRLSRAAVSVRMAASSLSMFSFSGAGERGSSIPGLLSLYLSVCCISSTTPFGAG